DGRLVGGLGGPAPGRGSAGVQSERRPVGGRVGGIALLDGLGHSPVDQLPAWRENPARDDPANTVMREVEALSQAMQDAPADQLFDPGGRLLLAEPGRLLEQSELEFAADDRGHGGERLAALPPPPEAP